MSPQLSFDIQVEIIKRLPVKSLIQFRSVCKTWKSLIDSSQFIAGYDVSHDQPQHLMISYLEKNEGKHVCFVDDDTFPKQKSFLTIPHLALTTTVIGSSHGLLCVNGYLQDLDRSSLKKMVVLWNPAIRRSIAIVVPDVVHPPSPFYSFVGFGVCPATKDPKLVNIRCIVDKTKIESISCIPCQVMVFTLSSGEWRCLCNNQLPRKSIQFECTYQPVIGQCIYWFANDWIDHVNGESSNLIMSFDLSTDEFKEVHLPDSLRKAFLCVSRLRESLVLLEDGLDHITNKQVCNIWMMEHGDQKVFTKLFTIKAPYASVFWTYGFRNNGEAIISVHDEDEHMVSQCEIVAYDPFLEHIKDLGIRKNKGTLYVNSYTESLLLLNHDAGHMVNCTWNCEDLTFGTV